MIKIIAVGKIKEQYLVNMIEDYLKRANKYHKLLIVEVTDDNPINEGRKVLAKIDKNCFKVALVISGKKFNSIQFAKFIDQSLMHKANINFIIGGSEGLSDEVLSAVDMQISFSDLTFPHGLFRAFLLEQIYRSFKILNNETYHK